MEKETALRMAHEIKQARQTACCIVGGGPGGAMLALLLARQGVSVTLLEARMDFDRDFRGDTIHPSVLNILDEIGLADRLLQLQHTKLHQLVFRTSGGTILLADFARVRAKYPYIVLLPQVAFLNFITEEAKRYSNFQLVMGAQVDELIEEDGRICGVRYHGQDGWSEVRAVLTIGADGRFSRIRKLASLEPIKTAPPMDVLWFRLSRRTDDAGEPLGHFENQQLFVTIDRFDYWQIGLVIPKGSYQSVRAAGLEELRQRIARFLPEFAERAEEIKEWRQIAVLSVESNRLPLWHRPGLLLIGDAAHVMSPVGGVGINYAIQDAVVAANILGGKLKYGIAQERDLAKVQRQRELPVRVIQAFQGVVQKRVLAPALRGGQSVLIPPFAQFMLRLPLLNRLPASLIGFGLWPAHVKK